MTPASQVMKPAKRTLQQEVEWEVMLAIGPQEIQLRGKLCYCIKCRSMRAIRRVFAKHRRGK